MRGKFWKAAAFIACSLALLLAWVPTQAAPARVQICTGSAASGAVASCTMSVTAGNLIVVLGGNGGNNSNNFAAATGSGGCNGTFTNLGNVYDGTTSLGQVIWSTPVASTASCTVSWGAVGDSSIKSIIAYELSGVDVSTAPNDGAIAFAATGIFSSPGPVTVSMTPTANASDILLAWITTSDTTNFTYTTVQSGWTADGSVATNDALRSAYQIVSSTGTYTAGWSTVTQTGGGGRYLRVAGIAIKAAGAGGSGSGNLSIIRVGGG